MYENVGKCDKKLLKGLKIFKKPEKRFMWFDSVYTYRDWKVCYKSREFFDRVRKGYLTEMV